MKKTAKEFDLLRTESFDLFENAFDSLMFGSEEPGLENVEELASEGLFDSHRETNENYLTRQNRLETLAKEKYMQLIGEITLSDMEEQLYSIKLSEDDDLMQVIGKISRSLVRPLLREIENEEDERWKRFLNLIHPKFKVQLLTPPGDAIPNRYITSRPAENEKVIGLIIAEDGYEAIKVYGTKLAPHSKNRESVLYKNGYAVADLAKTLSLLVILSQVLKVLRRENINEKEDMYFQQFLSVLKEYQDSVKTGKIGVANPQFPWEKHEFVVPSDKAGRNSSVPERFVKALRRSGCKVTAIPNRSMRGYVKSRMESQKEYFPRILDYWSYRAMFPAFVLDSKDIDYHDLLHYTEQGVYWPFVSRSSCHSGILSLIYRMFKIIAEEKVVQVKTLCYYNGLASKTHARSYQSKKNIPAKVVKEMEDSVFNDYFGFVEFDADCSMESVTRVAMEFIAIKNSYLPFIDSSKVSLRFRKLGNHKATGLYYPHLCCLCVDINSPQTFMHEYGHMIDYEYGRLSNEFSFKHIRDEYKKYLNSVCSKNPEVAKKLAGGSKYNKDYYLEPTEIFARSFELYMAKCKGIENSLIPLVFDWPYPDSESFLEHIRFYFDNILASIAMQRKVVS